MHPTMIRGRYFRGFFVEQHHFLHLKLCTVLFAERQSILAWNGVVLQREHLVGGEVEIPGKLLNHSISIYRLVPKQFMGFGYTTRMLGMA
jgi:hypothetical protein